MSARMRPGTVEMVTAAGHMAVLVGFLLPWVGGEFGARTQMSGLDLARLTDGMMANGLGGDSPMLPGARLVLFAVPVAAANALLVSALGVAGVLSRRAARRWSATLAAPAGAPALLALVLVALAARETAVVAGPAAGLYAVIAGATVALLAGLLPRRPPPPPRPASVTAAVPRVARPEA